MRNLKNKSTPGLKSEEKPSEEDTNAKLDLDEDIALDIKPKLP